MGLPATIFAIQDEPAIWIASECECALISFADRFVDVWIEGLECPLPNGGNAGELANVRSMTLSTVTSATRALDQAAEVRAVDGCVNAYVPRPVADWTDVTLGLGGTAVSCLGVGSRQMDVLHDFADRLHRSVLPLPRFRECALYSVSYGGCRLQPARLLQ